MHMGKAMKFAIIIIDFSLVISFIIELPLLVPVIHMGNALLLHVIIIDFSSFLVLIIDIHYPFPCTCLCHPLSCTWAAIK